MFDRIICFCIGVAFGMIFQLLILSLMIAGENNDEGD